MIKQHYYQKGEVVMVNLGDPPEQVKGHKQAYTRPCIIIRSFDYLKLAIIIPCTTKTPKYKLYTTVKLLKNSGGLTSDSFALCHQIRTISFDRISNKLGKLSDKDILKIHSVLIDVLQLSQM